jgi:hypothetical protein
MEHGYSAVGPGNKDTTEIIPAGILQGDSTIVDAMTMDRLVGSCIETRHNSSFWRAEPIHGTHGTHGNFLSGLHHLTSTSSGFILHYDQCLRLA